MMAWSSDDDIISVTFNLFEPGNEKQDENKCINERVNKKKRQMCRSDARGHTHGKSLIVLT
jgi:hypothetical protein